MAPKDGFVGWLMGRYWEPQQREPQEYSRNIRGIYLQGSLHSYYIPSIFLGSPVWRPHFAPFNGKGRVS